MGWIMFVIAVIGAAIALWQQRSKHEETLRSMNKLKERERTQLEEEHVLEIEELEKRLARQERDHSTRAARAHLPLVKDILPQLDDLRRALDAASEGNIDKKDLVHGLEMVEEGLFGALAKHDVTPIAPERAESFDPNVHEAIGVLEDRELPHQSVGALLRTGWQHENTTLRAAMVQINQLQNAAEITPAPGGDDGEASEEREDVQFAFDEVEEQEEREEQVREEQEKEQEKEQEVVVSEEVEAR